MQQRHDLSIEGVTASEIKSATELGDADQGAFVDRSSILRTSTTWNKQVDMGIYLLFYCC